MARCLLPLRRLASAAGLAGLAAWLVAVLAGSAGAGVAVGILPATSNVPPGTEFDLTLDVTAAGSPFNGFTAVVGYDTTALTFVPAASLPLQQGCLMTGACSAACGATFHRFTAAGDSLAITDHLLCDQISLTGPGTVYRLRFRAKLVTQITWIRIRQARFFNAGLFVTPVTSTDARVGIGVALDAGGPGPPRPGLSLRAEPNPARGPVAFAIDSDRAAPVRIEVFDLAGRLVRGIDAPGGPGASRVRWDGTDATGARVRPGVYLVAARDGARVARVRLAILD